jgi:hypothetical protein
MPIYAQTAPGQYKETMKAFNILVRARIALAVALFLFIACGAVYAREPLKLFDLTIPDRVAGLPHGKLRDSYETVPGMGYRVRFLRSGWEIDVSLYNRNRGNSSDNSNPEEIKREIEAAKNNVIELEQRMQYINNLVTRDYTIGHAGQFLCSAFTYVSLKDGPRDEYACVTGWKNKFFKIWMWTGRNKASREEARKFMEAWIPILWP